MTHKKEIYIKIFKIILIIFIPLICLELIFYYNATPRDFNYFYDIGSENDNYLSPTERISDKIVEDDLNYRNLAHQLVYFDVLMPRGAESIDIQVRFRDNFPKNYKFSMGARDKEEWSYKENLIYDEGLNPLNPKLWVVEKTSFNIVRDSLYLNKGKLNLFFNIHHLYKDQYKNHTIPIDWINITVHKKGWFED